MRVLTVGQPGNFSPIATHQGLFFLGISGQDGAYLAQLLLEKGYRVVGTTRDAQMATLTNLDRLGIRERIEVVSMAVNDFRSIIQVLAATAATGSL